MTARLSWRASLPADEWDAQLAALGGHPLQSALWGNARRAVDGIHDERWMALDEGRPVLMARVETRTVGRILRVAWLPKGPAHDIHPASAHAFDALLLRLKDSGFLLCIDDAYPSAIAGHPRGEAVGTARTAIVDLARGRDAVLAAIDRQWRYGVRAARRLGVAVEQSRDETDVAVFFALCERISATKGFELPGSLPLLRFLLAQSRGVDVEARLFCARFDGELIAGAVVLRSGPRLHYFWGGVDRRFPKQRGGEAVQWAVIEWALANGIDRYDLEGIDPSANPGTYAFKMKMAPQEIDLPGRRAHPLNMAGRWLLTLGRRAGRI